MPDCPNSPDGYHKWKPVLINHYVGNWRRVGQSNAECVHCKERLSERETAAMLNAAERLSAEYAEKLVQLANEWAEEVGIDRRATIETDELAAYAARRKDGG